MDQILKTEIRLCPSCMEVHEVETVKTRVIEHYKGKMVELDEVVFYCSKAKEYFEDEDMMLKNREKMMKIYKTGKNLK